MAPTSDCASPWKRSSAVVSGQWSAVDGRVSGVHGAHVPGAHYITARAAGWLASTGRSFQRPGTHGRGRLNDGRHHRGRCGRCKASARASAPGGQRHMTPMAAHMTGHEATNAESVARWLPAR